MAAQRSPRRRRMTHSGPDRHIHLFYDRQADRWIVWTFILPASVEAGGLLSFPVHGTSMMRGSRAASSVSPNRQDAPRWDCCLPNLQESRKVGRRNRSGKARKKPESTPVTPTARTAHLTRNSTRAATNARNKGQNDQLRKQGPRVDAPHPSRRNLRSEVYEKRTGILRRKRLVGY